MFEDASWLWFIASGVSLGLAGGLSAGPLSALVVSQTLRYGLREGATVAFAPVLTDGPLLLLGAVVMTEAQSFPVLTGSISLLGAGFLCWLALDCWHAGTPQSNTDTPPQAPSSIRKALLTNVLNPHPYLFWLMIGGPIFAKAWAVGAAHAALFITAFFSCLVGAKLGIAVTTHYFRSHLTGALYAWVMRGLALSIIGCALYFIYDAIIALSEVLA